MRCASQTRVADLLRMNLLRQTKVRNLGHAGWCDQHVVRLQVAVHNTQAMSCRESVGDSHGKLSRTQRSDRTGPFNFPLQRLPRHVFHFQKTVSLVAANGVSRDDIRMHQRRCSAPFVFKAGDVINTAGNSARRQNLQGTLAMQLHVASQIDDAHAATTKDAHAFVDVDGLAVQQCLIQFNAR